MKRFLAMMLVLVLSAGVLLTCAVPAAAQTEEKIVTEEVLQTLEVGNAGSVEELDAPVKAVWDRRIDGWVDCFTLVFLDKDGNDSPVLGKTFADADAAARSVLAEDFSEIATALQEAGNNLDQILAVFRGLYQKMVTTLFEAEGEQISGDSLEFYAKYQDIIPAAMRNSYLAENESGSGIVGEVMAYFDANGEEIASTISETVGMPIDKNTIGTALRGYLEGRRMYVESVLYKLTHTKGDAASKKADIQAYLADALTEITNGLIAPFVMMFGPIDLSAQISEFSAAYAEKLVSEFESGLTVATIFSDGGLFFLLIVIIEAGVIVALLISRRNQKKKNAVVYESNGIKFTRDDDDAKDLQ